MNSSTMRSALAFAAVALVCAILFMLSRGWIDGTMRDIAMVVIGGVLAKFNAVFDFYFGSSDGSKVKTDLMAGQPAELPGAMLVDEKSA